MFVMSTRNIIIPSPDGKNSIRLNKGQMGTVPGWAAKTAYFKALVADGKLVVSGSSRDKDEEKARKAAEQARKAAEKAAREAAEEGSEGDVPEETAENTKPEGE